MAYAGIVRTDSDMVTELGKNRNRDDATQLVLLDLMKSLHYRDRLRGVAAAMTDDATVADGAFRGGVIDGTPTAAADYTTRTAAQLVAEFAGCAVGDAFIVIINNKSSGANTITVVAGTGVTLDGTVTIAQNVCRAFVGFFTNVSSGSEAVSLYGIGG